MNHHTTLDIVLGCAGCHESFVQSAGELELLRLRGVAATAPQYCSRCRARGYCETLAARGA